jgi:hypothetical protein
MSQGSSQMIRTQCPNATAENDGLMPSQLAQKVISLPPSTLLPIATNQVVLVDNNASPASGSVPTISAAVATGANLIQFAPSATNYVWDVPNFTCRPAVGDGVPYCFFGTMTPVVNGTESVGGNTGAFTDGSLAMTPGVYRGKFVEVLTGASAGAMVCVIDNTATTVSLQSAVNISIGDQWQIVDHTAIIEFPDTAPTNIVSSLDFIGFSKLHLLDPTTNAVVNIQTTTCISSTCHWDNIGFGTGAGSFNVFGNGSFNTFFTTPWQLAGPLNPFASPSAQSSYMSTMFVTSSINNNFNAFIVSDMTTILSSHGAVLRLRDVSMRNSDLEFTNSDFTVTDTHSGIIKSTFDGDLFGNGYIILMAGNSLLNVASNSVMQNSSGAAVLLYRDGSATALNVSGVNAANGWWLFDMARLSSGSSTVTGPAPGTDMFFFGSGVSKSYSDPSFVDPVDFSQFAAVY